MPCVFSATKSRRAGRFFFSSCCQIPMHSGISYYNTYLIDVFMNKQKNDYKIPVDTPRIHTQNVTCRAYTV